MSAQANAPGSLHGLICENTMAVSVTIGVLIVLVLVLSYYSYQYYKMHEASLALLDKVAKAKSAFEAGDYVSYDHNGGGGNNSQWYNGSGDAGRGGSLDREDTRQQYAAVHGGVPGGFGTSCAVPWSVPAANEAFHSAQMYPLHTGSFDGMGRLDAAAEENDALPSQALDDAHLISTMAGH